MCERCDEIGKIKRDRAFDLERGLVGGGARIGNQYAAGQDIVSTQYTPMLVQMMFEIYQYPHMRSHYLYGTLEKPQQEVIELLKRAEIVVPSEAPALPGATPIWKVDEDALRTYVNAVCNVPLPTKTWVTR